MPIVVPIAADALTTYSGHHHTQAYNYNVYCVYVFFTFLHFNVFLQFLFRRFLAAVSHRRKQLIDYFAGVLLLLRVADHGLLTLTLVTRQLLHLDLW